MKKHILMALVMVMALSACKEDSSTLTKLGQEVPQFTFTTTEGEEINVSDLKGNVVLINFFATWCGPCMKELPRVEDEIWNPHKEKDFYVVSIGREHTMEEMQAFESKKGFTFPIAPDPDRSIYKKFASQNIPRNVLLDRDGKIIYQCHGFTEEEFQQLKDKINDAI